MVWEKCGGGGVLDGAWIERWGGGGGGLEILICLGILDFLVGIHGVWGVVPFRNISQQFSSYPET